jgi:cholest-4-en-3-one 26-monooxygenase
MRLQDIDLTDPRGFVDAVPYETFAYLRQEAPVWWHPATERSSGTGFWCVTRHADVQAVNRDATTYSSFQGGTNMFDLPPEDLAMIRSMMLNMDPPEHTRHRLLVNRGFTPRMISGLESRVQVLAEEVVDAFVERGEADFVEHCAAELPLLVICELMGVPPEDRKLVFDWSNRLVGFDDPQYQHSWDEGAAAAAEMFGYAQQLADRRRAAPGDDIITALLTAEVDGERLDDMAFNLFFLLLAVAGNETTRNALSHGIHALAEHPDQRRALAADPSLLPTAADEIIRWSTPVMYFRRTATLDTELAGQPIAAGDKVAIWYTSANRDETVFEDPDTFDIRRDPNPLLSFGGGGPHFCLGSNLAKMEVRVLVGELLSRVDDLELAGPVDRLQSSFINGIKSMPVRVTPAKV